MIGDWPTIIWRFIAASFGILLFAAGLHGYFITRTNLWQRLALVAGGLLLIKPEIASDIAGVVVAVVVGGAQILARRAEPLPAPAKPAADRTPAA